MTESVSNLVGSARPQAPRPLRSRRGEGAIASIVFPGVGHALVGRTARGAIWWSISTIALVAAAFWGFWPLAIAIGARVVTPIDFWIVTRGPNAMPPEGRATIVAGAFAGAWIAVAIALAFCFRSFGVPSGSMAPMLVARDHVVFRTVGIDVRSGDAIAFRLPRDPERIFVKRVVAMGGDTIAVKGDVPIVNGEVAEWRARGPYGYWDKEDSLGGTFWKATQATRFEEKLRGARYDVIVDEKQQAFNFPIESIDCRERGLLEVDGDDTVCRVPRGHLFVLGDNRRNSADSRVYGAIPDENVVGKPTAIWWSRGPDGVRWERLGPVD